LEGLKNFETYKMLLKLNLLQRKWIASERKV